MCISKGVPCGTDHATRLQTLLRRCVGMEWCYCLVRYSWRPIEIYMISRVSVQLPYSHICFQGLAPCVVSGGSTHRSKTQNVYVYVHQGTTCLCSCSSARFSYLAMESILFEFTYLVMILYQLVSIDVPACNLQHKERSRTKRQMLAHHINYVCSRRWCLPLTLKGCLDCP